MELDSRVRMGHRMGSAGASGLLDRVNQAAWIRPRGGADGGGDGTVFGNASRPCPQAGEAGEEVVLSRGCRPVATLVPAVEPERSPCFFGAARRV